MNDFTEFFVYGLLMNSATPWMWVAWWVFGTQGSRKDILQGMGGMVVLDVVILIGAAFMAAKPHHRIDASDVAFILSGPTALAVGVFVVFAISKLRGTR